MIIAQGLQTSGPRAMPRTCAVRLIDRRTGLTLRVNGSPLMIYTRNPDEAADELLRNRDTTIWEARIEPIEAEQRQ